MKTREKSLSERQFRIQPFHSTSTKKEKLENYS